MSRFFFHFECDAHSVTDPHGVELPDLAAARAWAETEASSLAVLPSRLDPAKSAITITDARRTRVDRVLLRDVLNSRRETPRCLSYA